MFRRNLNWRNLTLRQYSRGELQGRAVEHCHYSHPKNLNFHEYLGVPRAHCHRLGDFLVDDDIYPHALLGFSLEKAINSPFWIIGGRAT